MARLPRFVLPGQPQHIILRGNNRSEIFCAEADYRFFLEKLQLAGEKHGCEMHAYVLMTNHVHLLATPHDAQSLPKTMQMLGRYYVQGRRLEKCSAFRRPKRASKCGCNRHSGIPFILP